MSSLKEIGKRNFCDKWNLYLDTYEELWRGLQERTITLLEFGVYNGNSMRTWSEWFHGATLIGVDKHAAPRNKEGHRGEIIYGDQSNPAFLYTLVADNPQGFDIIIDDAGHVWKEQQDCFKFMWDHVNPGGMYIIEDLHTSMDKFWQKDQEQDTVTYLTDLASDVVLEPGAQRIKSIEFYPKMAVIKKEPAKISPNGL